MLASAAEHYHTQQRITASCVRAARASRMGPLDKLAAAVQRHMYAASADAIGSVGAMLDEQGITAPPEAQANPAGLLGVANDGRPLVGLLRFAQSSDVSPAAFDRLIASQVRDAARQSQKIEMATRPKVTRYARMLVTPSCPRCVVLAGRTYAHSTAFRRHPACDCRHIPTVDSVAGDLTTSPDGYFASLSIDEQDRIFTKAGAEAIRMGADISRVVDARAGMSTAQKVERGRWAARGRLTRGGAYGRQLYTTTELAGRLNVRVRLMPESILEIAEDRADALRLLRAHGYVLS